VPIPIKCEWFRVKNERAYKIEEINSNVYQLSAEDIGCLIRVKATPFEEEGVAYGEFGPVELDPAARQTLEYNMGTGGSHFPVTVILGSDFPQPKGSMDLDESTVEPSTVEANLYVNTNVIKLCFIDSYGGTEDTISLKYTIDYPKVELHPLDTQRFKIYYSDDKVNARCSLDKCLEMRAVTRQTRDLIALLVRSFSAQTYFINSKILANINNNSADIKRVASEEASASQIFLELDFVKRELYNQLQRGKELESEKQ